MCKLVRSLWFFQCSRAVGQRKHHHHMHMESARNPLVFPQGSWTFVFSVQYGCGLIHQHHHMHVQAAWNPPGFCSTAGYLAKYAHASVVGVSWLPAVQPSTRTYLQNASACVVGTPSFVQYNRRHFNAHMYTSFALACCHPMQMQTSAVHAGIFVFELSLQSPERATFRAKS
jgi:hypothetical protein